MKLAVFHGTKGSPQGNWFPWLKSALPEHTIYIPALPTPTDQHVETWVTATKNQIPDLNQVDVLIGHSCGASFIPHLITAKKIHPKKCILVSPFKGKISFAEYDELNRSFFLDDTQLKSAKNFCSKFIIYHGDNDPYVPLNQAKLIADALDADFRIIPNGGHLNAEFGYTSFPDILNDI